MRPRSIDKSRTLLAECLENLDRSLRRHPRDQAASYRRFKAYWTLGAVADQEGNSEESLGHLERAVAHGQECLRLKPNSEVIRELAHCRWSLAQSLRRLGDDERARSLILANLRMLDEVPKDDSTRIIAIWRTLVRLDLHQFKAGLSSAPASLPDEADPLSRLASSEADGLDAESWAELVARSLSSSPAAIDFWQIAFYMILLDLLANASRGNAGRAGSMRRGGPPSECTPSPASWSHGIRRGRPLTSLCVHRSTQMAKNAWQTDDRAAVERTGGSRSMRPAEPWCSIPRTPAQVRKWPTSRNGSTCSWRRSRNLGTRIAPPRRLARPVDERVERIQAG